MTLEHVAYIAQIIGVILVIGSLIYLSIQVRQGAELLRSDSRQAALGTAQHALYQFIEHPELGHILSSKQTPSNEDKIRLMFWIVAQMRLREHEWLQYKNGVLE